MVLSALDHEEERQDLSFTHSRNLSITLLASSVKWADTWHLHHILHIEMLNSFEKVSRVETMLKYNVIFLSKLLKEVEYRIKSFWEYEPYLLRTFKSAFPRKELCYFLIWSQKQKWSLSLPFLEHLLYYSGIIQELSHLILMKTLKSVTYWHLHFAGKEIET